MSAGYLHLQGELDFSGVPFQGSSVQSRHASYTGAQAAIKTWGVRTSSYLQLLQNSGGLTDQAAAELLHCGLSSICSIRNGLGERVEACGWEPFAFADGRSTKRTIWRLAR